MVAPALVTLSARSLANRLRRCPRASVACRRWCGAVWRTLLAVRTTYLQSACACVCADLRLSTADGLDHEGIFRLSGSAAKISQMKAQIDSGEMVTFERSTNIHDVCGLLKQYLRELPEVVVVFRPTVIAQQLAVGREC